MATPDEVCSTCRTEIDAQFVAAGGARDLENITGDLFVTDACFVRDEIRFVNQGRLIFAPQSDKREYYREYIVVCRKLVIIGGKAPGGGINPCGPDDPGDDYKSNNVITWQDRLSSAASGQPFPSSASDGTDMDVNNWSSSNNPNGNNGAPGNPGGDGNIGQPGSPGLNAPRFTLVALEVVVGVGGNLTIDFDGQNGGKGGKGQEGGDGGSGMGGRDGKSDTSWPGTGCDRQPGNGGNGGDGGDGGRGGDGGDGGAAGRITLISSADALATGPFFSGNMHYVNDGGSLGEGGSGGRGGRGSGQGGKPGQKTSECSEANDGVSGQDGVPDSLEAANANTGGNGSNGAGSSVMPIDLNTGTCLDSLPLPPQFTDIVPSQLCRGFGSAKNVDAVLTGANLAQVGSVTTDLANVTVVIKATSTDTQLDLRFEIAGNSSIGNGILTLKPGFSNDVTLNNAISVGRFEVTGVAPNTGSKGTQLAITISGTCFDPSAGAQQINVSGAGVTVLNPIILDSTTAQCVLDIANLAPTGPRSITVQTGGMSHTLLGAFAIS
ncbi:MAG: hypothetical protein BMS9Abin06_0082 [Gammaproteobacteria bacterium]|nr:MAG: hypothetical protein BMS9Abin06_0082 [Gammaproteobacteria bacterium]